jgi:diacylglycerol kinase (ATP)
LRIAVIYNPMSGRGRAAGAAAGFAEGLRKLGHEVSLLEAGLGAALKAGGAGAVVIAGGDGTLHHAVAELVGAVERGELAEAPALYQMPLGTENLFAREFGMTADPRRLHRLLAAGNPRPLDVGLCNGRAFVLMCGVGPDASILMRLNAAADRGGRRGPIRRRAYLGPILAELLALRLPVLTVAVDGRALVTGRSGLLVVGNSRQYAMRVDPAVRASMSDGVLDSVFFPARGKVAVLAWLAAARLRLHVRTARLIYATGRRIEVSADGPIPYQLDGEAFESDTGKLLISVRPGALRVWA